MLLESLSLAARWTELLSAASRVDIAVAWITSKDRTDDLLTFFAIPDRQVRVIVGVRDYLTSPDCLRRLHGAGLVRIGVGEHGCTFHPKLYLFAMPDRLVCWVGSANLTTSGFGGNTELVHEQLAKFSAGVVEPQQGDNGAASASFSANGVRV